MFLAPAILVFIGAAAVPIILHLLSQSRKGGVPWGAMMFLEDRVPRRERPRKLRLWLLLALRCLAIGLLVLAFARPVLNFSLASAPLATDTQRAAIVLLVDTSGSTSAPAGPGATRLDLIKDTAARALASAADDDSILLLTPASENTASASSEGAPSSPPPATGFTSDRRLLSSRIAALQPAAAPLDLPAALPRALSLLANQPARTRVIAVITDRQTSTFASLTPEWSRQWKLQARSAGLTRLTLCPTGPTDTQNISISSVELLNPPAQANLPATVQITLHNDGPPRANLPVRLRVGADAASDVTVLASLEPNADTAVTAAVTFPRTGVSTVVAEIPRTGSSTGPTFDDRMSKAVTVEGAAPVLVVSANAAPPLAIALTPHAGPARPGDLAVVTTVPPGAIPVYHLDPYAAIMIPDAALLSADERQALTAYVHAGGALLLSASNAAALHDLPVPPVDDFSDVQIPPLPSRLSPDGLPGVVIAPAFALPAAAGSIPFRYTDGSPAVLSLKVGLGQVVLTNISLVPPAAGGAQAASPHTSIGFVPFVQSLTRTLLHPPAVPANTKPSGESDLSTSEAALSTAAQRLGADLLSEADLTPATLRTGRELFLPLAATALICLLLESRLARRW